MFMDWTTCLYWNRWSWGSDIPLDLENTTLPNLGMTVFVIHRVNGVSQTPLAKSSIPGIELVAFCNCEVNRHSICVFNALISLDIIFLITNLMFIVPRWINPSGGGGSSDGHQARASFLLEGGPIVWCSNCSIWLSIVRVFPGVDKGCI